MALTMLPATLLEWSDDVTTTGTALAGAKVFLYIGREDNPTEIDDFTEASYSGYVAGGLAVASWGTSRIAGDLCCHSASLVYDGADDDPLIVQGVKGYAITNADGDTLLGWEDFPAEIQMGGVTSRLVLEILVGFHIANDYGFSVTG